MKQILFEPTMRVRYEDTPPESKPAYATIRSVAFVDEYGRFQKNAIPINADLTVIIGGKSTGKSVFLSSMARAIDEEEVKSKSAIARTGQQKFEGLDCIVMWRNGDMDLISNNEKVRRITYIPQMYIHRLVEDDNRPQLSDLVLRFLRQNSDFDMKYSQFVDDARQCCTDISAAVGSVFAILFSWRDINSNLKDLGEATALTDEVKNLTFKQITLQKSAGFTADETKLFADLTGKEKQFVGDLDRLERMKTGYRSVGLQAASAVRSTTEEFSHAVDDLQIEKDLDAKDVEPLLGLLTKLSGQIEIEICAFEKELDNLVSATMKNAENKTKDISRTRHSLKPLIDKVKNQHVVKSLQEQLKALDEKLRRISSLTAEKSAMEKRYWETFGT